MKAKKTILIIAAALLIAALSVAGTLAYLTASTDDVINTFTVGDIKITLAETSTPSEGVLAGTATDDGFLYHLQPGLTYDKEPVITVTKESEKCYVFAFVENGLGDNATITFDTTNWKAVTGLAGLYEYVSVVNESDEDNPLPAVFTTFTVNGELTNTELEALKDKTITISAFAHQADGVAESVAQAAAIAQFTPATESN